MSVPKFKIGVSGSMLTDDQETLAKAKVIGEEIAKNNCILLYGAGLGFPKYSAKGALAKGGTVVGISPAQNINDHANSFNFVPLFGEVTIFTGLGLHARDVVFVRSSDAVIFIGGGEGSLLEFTVSYRLNKVIGLLLGSGGITDHLEEIKSWFYKKPGVNPVIVKSKDPKELVQKVLEKLTI
ncbi:LOG family protein [Candidatus Gottesmanbacteria bacterium]|nr:LOG family protein [Candidatus Gottesmanbacteria bacterium]